MRLYKNLSQVGLTAPPTKKGSSRNVMTEALWRHSGGGLALRLLEGNQVPPTVWRGHEGRMSLRRGQNELLQVPDIIHTLSEVKVLLWRESEGKKACPSAEGSATCAHYTASLQSRHGRILANTSTAACVTPRAE